MKIPDGIGFMNKNIRSQINKDELIFADAFLKQEFGRIVDWAVGDIKKCCRIKPDGNCDDNGALVGAFILWCCAIEYFGGLYTGNPNERGTKARMEGFIHKYMNRYDSDKIYELRWSLLHYYSPHNYLMYHKNSLEDNKGKHLSKSGERIWLHLGWSIKDLEDAVNQYRVELEENNKLKIKAWKFFKVRYPIMPLKNEYISPLTLSFLASGTAIQSVAASGTVDESYWFKK